MIETIFMQQAVELAQRGANTTTPNPNVGCVIVKDGQVIGTGYHQQAGQPHAEINALKQVADKGYCPRGARVYVTLEPCSHHGKTPPCAEALIAAEVAEVIIGSADPNPQVSGRGAAKLRQAGISVTENILRKQCDELNRGFFKRMTTGLPWVTVKLGMSLDAKIATATGESQWITGQQSRADVQLLRAKSCAVMTSSATVIADNPSLNVRLDNVARQPKRVIVDSRLSVSPTAKIFTLDGEVLVYTSLPSPLQKEPLSHSSPLLKGEEVSGREITYFSIPEKNQHTDLVAVLKDLGENQHCNHVLVEAGGRFAGALLAENLVDELIIYTAPMLLGEGAKSAFAFPAVEKLLDAKRFTTHDCAIMGEDLKVIYRKKSSQNIQFEDDKQ